MSARAPPTDRRELAGDRDLLLAGADWTREHVRDPGHMPDVIDTSGRAAADVAADSLAWVRAAREA